jgi:ATP-dependent helicase HepA
VAWTTGDFLTHRFNPELGIGRVTAVDGRALVVNFPRTGATLRIAASSDALTRVAADAAEPVVDAPLLPAEFDIRSDLRRLRSIREDDVVGSFLGGRVRLFPHQLYAAERATAHDPVRWLLADEVGLGKTIEACLILNRLVHTGRVERCLVVVPEALTVQWLGELWRKYHQVFTLLDGPRLADVARDFGAGFNPFDVHRRVVIALETLTQRPELTEDAVRAGIDLLVVDEAQRVRRPPGHPGDAGWRAIAPIAARGRHVLLLSATPLEDDAHGFFRLLQLLRPDEFPESERFEDRLARATPLPPCTSSTRRVDIGGLPPRVGIPVGLEDDTGWQRHADVEAALRRDASASPKARSNPVSRRQAIDRIRRALASGAALGAVLGPDERALRQQAEAMEVGDPRVEWLLANAPPWRDAKEKTLVFVAHRETLEMLRTALSHRAQLATGVFHEQLSAARRDTEVARFREPDGPSLLVSTECGGEGRNFEFCRRLVLFDLPWKPTVVEQRIGRLDRIGRHVPVEVVYFRPPRGIGVDVVRLFETLGVFREPLAGLEPQLAHVETAIEDAAVTADASLSDERLEQLIADARAARTRIREAAYQQLHRDPYRAEMAEGILARVPADLDALTERVVTTACAHLGFRVEHLRGRRTFAIEFGSEAVVDSLPGVPGGSAYVGTFDREEAVEDESIDFFASGHPLVEGVLAYFEDATRG